MTTNQPKWKLIANLGDVNPIEYGGYFIYEDETGVYAPEGEILESPESDESSEPWRVYRFSLDRLEQVNTEDAVMLVPFGFSDRTDLPHHISQYDEWFNKDLTRAAETMGRTVEELRADFCSPDPLIRARVYEDIGRYHGFENLDSYPLEYSEESEIRSRYSNELARK
jgi:hypothetical protein